MSDYRTLDLDDLCVYCGIDTSKSGFVNRVPADNVVPAYMPNKQFGAERVVEMWIRLDGYMCPDCQNSDEVIDDCLLEAYDEGGPLAVWVWCERNHPEWEKSRCEPCEDITHTWGRVCTVCWSEKDNKEV